MLLAASSAQASVHLMQIEKVIGGVDGDSAAQAVQLRLRSGGQNNVQNARVVAYDAAGLNPVVISNIDSPVSSASAGDRVLLYSDKFAETQARRPHIGKGFGALAGSDFLCKM